jgi:hypothetical protein
MAERKAQSETRKAVTGKLPGKPLTKPGAVKKAAVAASEKLAVKAAVTKKPAAKKTAAPAAKKDAPAKKAVLVKKAAPVKRAAAKKTEAVSGEAFEKSVLGDRFRMVQTAAYFIAERQGFGGNPVDHWLAAEIEISRNLG